MNGIVAQIYAKIKNISTTEAGVVDGVTAGTATASKAVVLNSAKHINELNTASLKLGATGATVAVTATAAELNKLASSTLTAAEINAAHSNLAVLAIDGSTGKKACAINGLTVVTGGTGIADLTLAAPAVGSVATIRIGTLSSGAVVVTCAAGVTLNGTNNVATFNAVDEALQLVYKAANTWEVVTNIGAVALSTAA